MLGLGLSLPLASGRRRFGSSGITTVGVVTDTAATSQLSGSVALPAGTQAGDVVMIWFACDTGQGGWGVTGFSEIAVTGSANPRGGVLLGPLSGAVSSVDWSTAESNSATAIICGVYRGVDTSTPLDVPVVTSEGAASMPIAPAIIPALSRSMLWGLRLWAAARLWTCRQPFPPLHSAAQGRMRGRRFPSRCGQPRWSIWSKRTESPGGCRGFCRFGGVL